MNFITPLDRFTGYGITGYNIFNNLYNLDDNLTLFFAANPNIEKDWDVNKIKNAIDRQSSFNSQDNCFKLWTPSDLFTRTAGSSKYGSLSFFEIDFVFDKEKAGYNLCDVLFVPSLWAKQVLENNGIKTPIIVCPQGVDTNIFFDNKPEDKPKDKYIFINIGKWEIRKGHDVLVQIFNSAFNDDDNVELWMMNHNPFLSKNIQDSWVKMYADSKLNNKIKFFPRVSTQSEVSKIMSYADCGIFPSRAEGWNNEAIEMMAMNKPIIITNYSAHTQYCNNDNSYLIDIDQTEPAIDNLWFNGDGNWAKLDAKQIEQAVEHMRFVYKNRIDSNPAGLQTASYHNWSKTANIIYDYMK